ncbi:cytosolic protein [Virgibacillus oceani]
MNKREFKQGAEDMSFRQFLHKYFSNHQETMDKHWDPVLKTRYFKITKEEGFDLLKKMVENEPEFEMNAISIEHGEMSFYLIKGKSIFIVATVIMIRPYHTAIDFAATSESVFPFDFGYSRRLISQLYDRLNKEMTPVK